MHHKHHGMRLGVVLAWSLVATVLFVVIEVLAGLQAHSLALLSDAGHNFTDALALALAALGFYFESRPANEIKTYGYHRAGVLTAFVNALALLALAGFIFRESYFRFRQPEPVHETTMFVIAGLGLILNVVIMWGLHRDQGRDLNVRAAYLHMLGDALGSVGIIIGAGVIRFTGWYVVDPILSVIIGALIVWTAWDVVRDTLNILLEGLPKGMRLETVVDSIREIPGVANVHDLHIWSLGTNTHALSCHVLIADLPPSESEPVLRRINKMLADRFHIHHTTVQFEHAGCALSENGCCIQRGEHRHS
ncbi:MAG: cation transporter [Bryobacteraceae bacterium]|nr:cation transporter [Bryobacteraceae bacterium]